MFNLRWDAFKLNYMLENTKNYVLQLELNKFNNIVSMHNSLEDHSIMKPLKSPDMAY